MSATTIRGLLLSMLIGAAMVAGVLLAAPGKADTQQDYTYYAMLEGSGISINSPAAAKELAGMICNSLNAGRDWRLVMTDMMTGADWDTETAAIVLSAAIIAYCPQHDFRDSDTVA